MNLRVPILRAPMLNETILVDTHKEMGGKLVDFGGWNMPLHYGSQREEHDHVRSRAGMFDVSHMTVVDVSGQQARDFLRYLLANDVDKLKSEGKALYSGMLNDRGGVIDDLIVYLMADGYRLVVNCGTREKDLKWINEKAQDYQVQIDERDDYSMVAVQGPLACGMVNKLLGSPESLAHLSVFQGANISNIVGLNGFKVSSPWFVARTGYTGEEGYEIMLPHGDAVAFWRGLADLGVKPCGLGARDTLRLEAGMNLYGHEMDDDVSPLFANMGWTIAWEPSDRQFVGRDTLVRQKEEGVTHKLVGLVLHERGVLRAGQCVALSEPSAHDDAYKQGIITSGTFSPTLGYSIAMARVPVDFSGQAVVLIRNKWLSVDIVKPCFVRNGKKVN